MTYLRECGCRMTETRAAILRTLFASKQPLSLEEIQARTETAEGTRPDYVTVFRLITQLQELHLVAKVPLGKSVSYFELRDPHKHYDHLVCRECGKIQLLDIPCPVSKTERLLAKQWGYAEISHNLEFFGICPECRQAVQEG